MNDSQTTPAKPLAYEAPDGAAYAWPTVARWTAAATAALAGAYFLNGVAIGVYYLSVGRPGYHGLHLVGTYSWPLYLIPLVAGVLCLRRSERQRWNWILLKWGLAVLIGVRALVALTNVAIGLLAASPSPMASVNVAGGAVIAQYFFNGVTDVVPPATLLWLVTRPAFRDALVRP